jgi:hypothetical protein
MRRFTPNLNWDEHKKDPDNWVKIPAFHVMPETVNYENFFVPILGPSADDFQWRVPVYEAVKSLRDEARRRFVTLDALRADLLDALERTDEIFLDEAPLSWTSQQVFAFRYTEFMWDIEKAVTHHRNKKEDCINGLAHALSLLSDIHSEKPLDQSSDAIKRMMAGASAGGRKSAQVRQANKKVPAPDVLRAERDSLISGGVAQRSVAGVLARRYGCTPTHIRSELNRN